MKKVERKQRINNMELLIIFIFVGKKRNTNKCIKQCILYR